MSPEEMKAVLDDIESGFEGLKMVETPSENLPANARVLEGTTPNGWKILVIEFSTEDIGGPEGGKGYDGTAVKAPNVVHLTPELAEKAAKHAAV